MAAQTRLSSSPSPLAPAAIAPGGARPIDIALLASVFVVAACGLLYELAAGALASYVLGDSVLQFSTIIGTYLFAMGVGSWLSRYFERQLPAHFLRIELLVALIGGALPATLFLANAYVPGAFRFLLYGMVLMVGTLVGLEIPLVMRILKRSASLKDLVSKVLTFDYLGALAVSLAFPIVLVPKLGLVRTGLLFGFMNAAIAGWALVLFKHELRNLRAHSWACAVVMTTLGLGVFGADHLTKLADDHFYQDRIVLSSSSPYQRIVVTQGRQGARLYLNGNLQFAQSDEYRYHEALVHPGLASLPGASRVLVLGGGDGLAVREILRYGSVEAVTLVDLDPEMTRLFASHPLLTPLNDQALRSPKVRIVNADALKWLEENEEVFDFIVVDFPDPTHHALGKLYSNLFYRLLDKHLAAHGAAVVQTTSPFHARRSFWCIVRTIESAGFTATPYHAYVPAFGEWGFTLATRQPWQSPDHYPPGLRFLTPELTPTLFQFPPDMGPVEVEINRLNNQILVHYYEREWREVTP